MWAAYYRDLVTGHRLNFGDNRIMEGHVKALLKDLLSKIIKIYLCSNKSYNFVILFSSAQWRSYGSG